MPFFLTDQGLHGFQITINNDQEVIIGIFSSIASGS